MRPMGLAHHHSSANLPRHTARLDTAQLSPQRLIQNHHATTGGWGRRWGAWARGGLLANSCGRVQPKGLDARAKRVHRVHPTHLIVVGDSACEIAALVRLIASFLGLFSEIIPLVVACLSLIRLLRWHPSSAPSSTHPAAAAPASLSARVKNRAGGDVSQPGSRPFQARMCQVGKLFVCYQCT